MSFEQEEFYEDYPEDGHPDPGSFDHRSGDCPKHGANVVFARPKGSRTTPLCVECMLDAAEKRITNFDKSG